MSRCFTRGVLAGLAGRLLLALTTLTTCALGLEGVARLNAVARPAGPRTIGTLRRYHPTLGWEHPPGHTGRYRHPEFSVDVRINSRGLRGPDRDYVKRSGVRRVLLLGDSFTEAYTVDEPETPRAVAEDLLNAAGCGPHEVINAGVSGYGTDQAYLFLLDEGWRYEPDVVVLLFFGNDLSDNSRRRKKPYFDVQGDRLVLRNSPVERLPGSRLVQHPRPEDRDRTWRGSVALDLLGRRTASGNPRLHRALARLGLVRPLERHGPTLDWLCVYGPESPRTEQMWRRTAALLGALKEAATSIGSGFAVFYVPARFEVNDRDWRLTRSRWGLVGEGWRPDRVFQRLFEECGVRGIPLIDPRGQYRRAESSPEPAYLRRDPHWTVIGNQIAGRHLASFILSRLPDPCRSPVD